MAYYITDLSTLTVDNRVVNEGDVVVSKGETPIYPLLETKNQEAKFPKHKNTYAAGEEAEIKWVKAKAPKLSKEDKELLVSQYGEDYEKQGELIYSK